MKINFGLLGLAAAQELIKSISYRLKRPSREIIIDMKKILRNIHLQAPSQKFKIWSTVSSQKIGSSSVSLEMIFEALQSEQFWFKFNARSPKMLKIPNLTYKYCFF